MELFQHYRMIGRGVKTHQSFLTPPVRCSFNISGRLPLDATPEGLGQLLEIEGRPKWRVSGSINWESGPVEVGLYGQYTGKVGDTSVVRDVLLVSDDPNANFYRLEDQFLTNVLISYTINNNTALDGTRLRFGVNN
jgi:iron complex outermembrane recepter protein